MKKLLLAGLVSVAVALPVVAALQKGDTAPMFTARASLAGKEFNYSLAEALKQGPVVVYFYPSAYTQGCNIQAHTFAENMDAFKAAKASVVGVSLDSIQRLNDFSADPAYCAGKLPVASDADGSIAKSYGVNVREGRPGMPDTRGVAIDHGFAERLTFIVNTDGKVVTTIGGQGVAADQNVHQALQAVKDLAAL
jgi:thioredoxin-dependent peroxiredoxin